MRSTVSGSPAPSFPVFLRRAAWLSSVLKYCLRFSPPLPLLFLPPRSARELGAEVVSNLACMGACSPTRATSAQAMQFLPSFTYRTLPLRAGHCCEKAACPLGETWIGEHRRRIGAQCSGAQRAAARCPIDFTRAFEWPEVSFNVEEMRLYSKAATTPICEDEDCGSNRVANVLRCVHVRGAPKCTRAY